MEIDEVKKLYGHPILDAYLEKRWEIYEKHPDKAKQILNPTEDYIENWRNAEDHLGKPVFTNDANNNKNDWMKVWKDQHWHLFSSWIDTNKKKKSSLGYAKCTELCIWLYEVQGWFKEENREKKVLDAIKKLTIKDFPASLNPLPRNEKIFGKKTFSWNDIKKLKNLQKS